MQPLYTKSVNLRPVSQNVTGTAHLLRRSAGTILEMANVAKGSESFEADNVFCINLAYHCLRLWNYSEHALDIASQGDSELLGQILDCLGSLIGEIELRGSTEYAFPLQSRLKMLAECWEDVRGQSREAKCRFVEAWLIPVYSKEKGGMVNQSLNRLLGILDQKSPEALSARLSDDLSIDAEIESTSVVSPAAQSTFDALFGCMRCPCHPHRDREADLEMRTYRKPIKSDQKAPRDATELEKPSFSIRWTFDRIWNEILIRSVAEKDMHPGRASPSRTRVEKLCSLFGKINRSQRLVLGLTGSQLYKVGKQKGTGAAEPVSLSQLLEEEPGYFTEKTKRIIILIVGYTTFQLMGTRWLEQGCASSNVRFLRIVSNSVSSIIPLAPFIQTRLEEPRDDDNESLVDLDDWHPCPAVLALAVVLMEVYFVTPFDKLAEKYNAPLEAGPITYTDVLQVFNGIPDDPSAGGCRLEIPKDSHLLALAIDNCLDAELWMDEQGQTLDCETARSHLLKRVVRPLELYLSRGFSHVPLDDIDEYARTLDLSKWGQPITRHTKAAVGNDANHRTCNQRRLSIRLKPGNSMSSSGKENGPVGGCQSLQFFDDETDEGIYSKTRRLQYLRWRDEYALVVQKFTVDQPLEALPPSKLVRVAILDTGIDIEHADFEARGLRLGGHYNCYDKAQGDVEDKHGHGTFVASLILDYAPDAELYVVKITDRENTKPKAEVVAEAIHHAVDWGVDIISMSFGWPSADFDGREAVQAALDRAHGRQVLMFAAASNSGGRRGRAYPASSPAVVCVHSTGVNGGRSDFSPTAERHKRNFATVGESVVSAWPGDDGRGGGAHAVQSRSGTSYATAVLAGIAAFLLHFARLHLPEDLAAQLRRKEKMEGLLQKCAERGPDATQRDDYSYVHLSLETGGLFGRSLDSIKSSISEMLKTL